MADTQTTVTTLDIQLLDESREGTVTIKLDNPKSNVTREQVSTAMQPAFTNQWFLVTTGKPAMYLGDVTINQSIKTKLGGEDFYVTPSSIDLQFTQAQEKSFEINVSGATIQGYNFVNSSQIEYTGTIINNGLTFKAEAISNPSPGTYEFTTMLVIMGTIIEIPCNITITN